MLGQNLLARVAALNNAARDAVNWSPSGASASGSFADERPGAVPIEADAEPSEAGTLTLSSLVSESTDASMCIAADLRSFGPSFLPLATLFESSQSQPQLQQQQLQSGFGGEQQWRAVGGRFGVGVGVGAFRAHASPIPESPERETSPAHSASSPTTALGVELPSPAASASAPSASIPLSATGTITADAIAGGDVDEDAEGNGEGDGEGEAGFMQLSNVKMAQLSSPPISGLPPPLPYPPHFSHDYAVRPTQQAYMTSDGPMA